MSGLWTTVARSGNFDVLRQWVHHWLDESGDVWHMSRGEVRSAVEALINRAVSIGEDRLAESAVLRLNWLPFGYLDRKEYGFDHVYSWFRSLARRRPSIWSTLGWKLWTICEDCDRQGGDNRYEDDIFNEISAAAILCGADDWWQLISSTLSRANQTGWHAEIRGRLVDGACAALRNSSSLEDDDLLAIWCLAIAISFWTSSNDNSSLESLRAAMLVSRGPDSHREAFVNRLDMISQRTFLDRLSGEQRGGVVERDDDTTLEDTTPATLSETVEQIEADGFITISEDANAIQQIDAWQCSEREQVVPQIPRSVGACSDYSRDWASLQSYPDHAVTRIAGIVSDEELWCIIEALARDLEYASSWMKGIQESLLRVSHARACNRSIEEHVEGLAIQIETHGRWAFGNMNGSVIDWPVLPNTEESLKWQSG